MQLSFGDAEHTGKRKLTRKEIFLAEMEQVVPWNTLRALIAPHYPKMGRPGRQPYALATMLRIHFLGHPFRVVKRQFGYVKVRYRGLAKNAVGALVLESECQGVLIRPSLGDLLHHQSLRA